MAYELSVSLCTEFLSKPVLQSTPYFPYVALVYYNFTCQSHKSPSCLNDVIEIIFTGYIIVATLSITQHISCIGICTQ